MGTRKPRIAFLTSADCSHDQAWVGSLAPSVEAHWIYTEGRTPPELPGSVLAHAGLVPKTLGVLPALSQFGAVGKIRASMDAWRVEAVHAMYGVPHAVWAALSGRPYGVTLRGSDLFRDADSLLRPKGPLQNLSFPVRRSVFRRAMAGAGFVTGTSRKLLAAAAAWGARPEALHLVRTGIPLAPFESHRRPRPPAPVREILSMRRSSPLYDLIGILEGFALTARKHPQARLTIIDDRFDPDYSTAMRRRAEELQLGGRCRFVDALSPDGLRELVASSDVSVMIPLSDGTPVSAVECMALGTPVLLGDAGYDPDLFTGDTSWSVRGRSAEALAAALEELIGAPAAEVERRASNARAAVRSYADRALQMAKVVELYGRLC